MGVGAVTYPRRSAWFSIIVRSSSDGRAGVVLAVGDEASREPTRKDWKDLPPLTDSVESMDRESEAKLSTRGGMAVLSLVCTGSALVGENMTVSSCSSFYAVAKAAEFCRGSEAAQQCNSTLA